MAVQYKQFRIGDVFNLERTRKTLNAQDLTIYEAADDGLYPYVVRQSRNNGIKGYVFVENQEWLNPGNTISFAQDTAEMFYQSNPYVTGNNMRVMTIQGHDMTEEIALFLISALRKTFSSYSWGMSFRKEVLDNEKISLPVTLSGTPDWDYMQERIAELEQERIAELENYLTVTGLNDYELTDEDIETLSLSGFRGDEKSDSKAAVGLRKEMREFRMGDLFEYLKVVKAKKANVRSVPDNEFCVPVVYAKFGNNGIMYWGRKGEFTTYRNVISIVYNGVISAGRVYAQEDDTGILAESYLIRVKGCLNIPFRANQYMAEFIEKVIYPHYSREFLAIWNNRVENEIIPLPICTDAANNSIIDSAKTYHPDGYVPDWDFMSRYIRAIEKIVIKDVVKYKNEMIQKTKEIVGVV